MRTVWKAGQQKEYIRGGASLFLKKIRQVFSKHVYLAENVKRFFRDFIHIVWMVFMDNYLLQEYEDVYPAIIHDRKRRFFITRKRKKI